jgi:hypothetical protein
MQTNQTQRVDSLRFSSQASSHCSGEHLDFLNIIGWKGSALHDLSNFAAGIFDGHPPRHILCSMAFCLGAVFNQPFQVVLAVGCK